MTRVRIGSARHRKHKKIMKAARGFRGAMSRRFNLAKQKTFRAGVYATRDRRRKKRDFRRLWIVRINAACRQRGVQYSRFIRALAEADIRLDRKVLSDMAIADPAAFDAVFAAAMPEEAAKAKAQAAARQPPAQAAQEAPAPAPEPSQPEQQPAAPEQQPPAAQST